MVLDRRRLLVLDAGRVAAARVASGPRALRLTGYAEAPLSSGALLPSPVEENLVRADDDNGIHIFSGDVTLNNL